MKRFIQGEVRTQSTLLPEILDYYIAEANPVRVVDVYVDELIWASWDLKVLIRQPPVARPIILPFS
jgi:hypothetical protein